MSEEKIPFFKKNLKAGVDKFGSFRYTIKALGGVAQLGERLNGIQEVKSSILSVSTKKRSQTAKLGVWFLFF